MPPVYKCILPIETSLASSGQRRKQSRRLPYPAWPYIDDSHRPCCLPTLLGARYFEHRGTLNDPDEAITRAAEYLSHREEVESEIRQQAQVFVEDQNAYSLHLLKFTSYAPILMCPSTTAMDAVKASVDSLDQVLELGMQGLIEGHRANLYGEKEAFALGHEFAHFLAGLQEAGGGLLGKLSEYSQQVLLALAAFRVAPEQIPGLWEKFWECNGMIADLAPKFEPVEEIFATYAGLRFSPTEVRSTVEPLIKLELEKRRWDKAYESFAAICDASTAPLGEASNIYDPVCRMIHWFYYRGIDINSVKLLCTFIEIRKLILLNFDNLLNHWLNNGPDEFQLEEVFELLTEAEMGVFEQINRILEQARIPQDIYWTVSATLREVVRPKLISRYKALINKDLPQDEPHDHRYCTRITLIGLPSKRDIGFVCRHDGEEDKFEPEIVLSASSRIFFESLRQQLDRRCGRKGVKLVCPVGGPDYTGECCGWDRVFQAVHKQLPEATRRRFTLPDCARFH